MRLHKHKVTSAVFLSLLLAANGSSPALSGGPGIAPGMTTPIKHLVVIFGENISFDHYFGTYPNATNPPGEPAFNALYFTPGINGLSGSLLTSNPNLLNSANGSGAANPFRIDRSQAVTSDMNHAYTPEQQAYDNGAMDLFPKYTGKAGVGGTGAFNTTGLVMGYFDGNTVTALWNYAQRFAMNDAAYTSQFGPSSPGAINVISGQTNGAVGHAPSNGSSSNTINNIVADGQGGYTMYGDSDPFGDACASTTAPTTSMTGKNIGDLLNAKGITWGFFQGGFDLTVRNSNGTTGCSRSSANVNGSYTSDYSPHHQPFQYYASTQNLAHTRPTSPSVVGTSNDGGANHQYDTHDFFDALNAGNMPAVSYLKAPAYEDGHAGYSDPLDEQTFIVTVTNAVTQSQFWNDTAIIITYDDSDGWYDHANHVINPSTSVDDALQSAGVCAPIGGTGTYTPGTPPSNALPGLNGAPVNGRCGYGTRIPFVVISPYAIANFVDHTVLDQSSVIRFIEDNWLGGQRIGQGSYDGIANPINNMFNFRQYPHSGIVLNPSLGTIQ